MVISNSYVSLPDGMFYDKSFMIVFLVIPQKGTNQPVLGKISHTIHITHVPGLCPMGTSEHIALNIAIEIYGFPKFLRG